MKLQNTKLAPQKNEVAIPAQSVVWGLVVAILALSWAAMFVRWAGNVPALIIAFYRMLWCSLLVAVIVFRSGTFSEALLKLNKRDWLLTIAAGLFLALHFACWIGALQYTSVAKALVLYSIHPVLALLLAPLMLNERAGRLAYVAAAITMVGVLLIAFTASGEGESRLFGNVLGVAAALFIALYLLVARKMRGRVDLSPYLLLVYTASSLILLFMSLFAGHEIVAYPGESHFFMLLLALVPTGIGHSLLNWAARHIASYKVNISILGETVLASILAYFFFAEVPELWFYPGAAIILVGIILAMREGK
ncbi:MAG: DMT family transporter [Calditrichia bacterium]